MHIIQIVRLYLGLTQKELAQRAGIGQPDLCEMEIKEPYGRIDKRLYLSIRPWLTRASCIQALIWTLPRP